MYGCMFIVRPNGKKLCIGSSGLKITKPLTLTFFFSQQSLRSIYVFTFGLAGSLSLCRHLSSCGEQG